ncbi:MAG: hypothetical protein ABEH59_04380 [Halobacteriales archaeon]
MIAGEDHDPGDPAPFGEQLVHAGRIDRIDDPEVDGGRFIVRGSDAAVGPHGQRVTGPFHRFLGVGDPSEAASPLVEPGIPAAAATLDRHRCTNAGFG